MTPTDAELYALSESFFAQDCWDGAEPHVIAVAFAKEIGAKNLESRTAPDTASREPHDGWMNAWLAKNNPPGQHWSYLWDSEARKFAGDWADFRVANLESRTVAPQPETEK